MYDGYEVALQREHADETMGADWIEHPETIIGECPHCRRPLMEWDRMCFPEDDAQCPYFACRRFFQWGDV